jgi:hypothetical protein
MPAKGSTRAETQYRASRLARIIASGGKRSDCVRYAAETWGVSERSVDKYIGIARQQIREDWAHDTTQMLADLLSQTSSLHMEARKAGQLHIALGCINTMAKLAKLIA